ncbi:NUDIX hydrolase domain-like protein [Jimgerdemannia flammicorona]|uniref:NUDIX hydrolase domain-like protein n=1 Tax=Jimgerdemannia flammicorona TaxID=994334 RepID=A0A433D470_9FUNG|nr:NUDIX hydrolase domain-like protein [Jimgerdemannia flammicorona]
MSSFGHGCQGHGNTGHQTRLQFAASLLIINYTRSITMLIARTFLELFDQANNFPFPDQHLTADDFRDPETYCTVPFKLGDQLLGVLLPSTVAKLKEYNARQQLNPFLIGEDVIRFDERHVKGVEERTAVVRRLLEVWREERAFKCLAGWRDELYPVYGDPNNQPSTVAFVLERAAAPLFGVVQFGSQLNGYVRDPVTGEIKMWIGRRAMTKHVFPGRLDTLVGGGIPYGQTPYETMVRECAEEANIPESLAKHAKAVGVITFVYHTDMLGIFPETLYIYDLELSANVIPVPVDGEVECFYCWGMDEVKKHILAGEFYPGITLVIIDFLIRHGLLTAENEPDYVALCSRLRRKLDYAPPRYVI